MATVLLAIRHRVSWLAISRIGQLPDLDAISTLWLLLAASMRRKLKCALSCHAAKMSPSYRRHQSIIDNQVVLFVSDNGIITAACGKIVWFQ